MNRIIRADEAQMAQIVEPVLSAAVVEPEATTTVSDPAPVEDEVPVIDPMHPVSYTHLTLPTILRV